LRSPRKGQGGRDTLPANSVNKSPQCKGTKGKKKPGKVPRGVQKGEMLKGFSTNEHGVSHHRCLGHLAWGRKRGRQIIRENIGSGGKFKGAGVNQSDVPHLGYSRKRRSGENKGRTASMKRTSPLSQTEILPSGCQEGVKFHEEKKLKKSSGKGLLQLWGCFLSNTS